MPVFCFHAAKLINRGGNQLSNVQYFDAVLLFPVLDAVCHHRIAKWTGGGDYICTGGDSFAASLEIYSRGSFFFLLEHLGTSCSATEPFTPAPFHFNKFCIEGFQHLPRGFVDIIGPAQVTTVMIGDFLPFEASLTFQPDLSIVDQLLQKTGMMNNFVLSSQIRVLIFQ